MIQMQQNLMFINQSTVESKFGMEEIWNVCQFELPAFDMYCRLKLWSGIRCVNVLDILFWVELAVAVRNGSTRTIPWVQCHQLQLAATSYIHICTWLRHQEPTEMKGPLTADEPKFSGGCTNISVAQNPMPSKPLFSSRKVFLKSATVSVTSNLAVRAWSIKCRRK